MIILSLCSTCLSIIWKKENLFQSRPFSIKKGTIIKVYVLLPTSKSSESL